MDYTQVRFGEGVKEINILFLGDTHIGHENSDISLIDKVLNKIEKKENGRIVLMGDLCEISLRNSKGNVYEQLMSPGDQIDYWSNKLKDYKDILIGGISGNHNERAVNEVGINPCKLIFKILGEEEKYFGYSSLIKFSFNKGCLHAFCEHGSTGARTKGGILNVMYKMRNRVEADIYCMGHTHQLLCDDTSIRSFPDSRNMKVQDKRYYFISTGTSLSYDNSYAEQKGYEKNIIGFPILTLKGERGEQQVTIDKVCL